MAVDADRGRSEAGVGLTYGAATSTNSDRCRRAWVGSGNQLGELDEVASVEWEVDDLVGVDDSADDGIFGLGGNGNRVDLNDLANRADFQLGVDAGSLAHLERNAFQSAGLEARRFYGDCVAAGGEEWNVEVSGSVRGDGAYGVCCDVLDVDGGVWDDAAGSFSY